MLFISVSDSMKIHAQLGKVGMYISAAPSLDIIHQSKSVLTPKINKKRVFIRTEMGERSCNKTLFGFLCDWKCIHPPLMMSDRSRGRMGGTINFPLGAKTKTRNRRLVLDIPHSCTKES